MIKYPIKIGQEILTDHKLEKEFTSKRNRIWKKFPIKEIPVFIIGIRTIQNGYIDGNREDGRFFVPVESIKAWLVVKNLNTKPFYILRTN